MINDILRKGLVLTIVVLFVEVSIVPNIFGHISSKPDDNDRWAVIIGVSDYLDPTRGDLYSPSRTAIELFELLKTKGDGWNDDNMLLLLNETATKQNILDAFEWLKTNANSNDTILFFFSGHGDYLPDENNDELDLRDETICPHDAMTGNETTEPMNFITDDELRVEFEEIYNNDIKGIFLAFDSCFSGGLINWRNRSKSTDIDTGDKVILTSTTPHGISISYGRSSNFINCGRGISKAIEKGKSDAEDIAKYARIWFITKPQIFIYPFLTIFTGDQLYLLLLHRALILPFPLYKDGYPIKNPHSENLYIVS
jgi:hypothetical protein